MTEADGQHGAASAAADGARAPAGWTLLAVWAALGLWSVCLWVLSGRALGCCWSGMIETASAELLALAAALAAPGVFVNVMFSAAMLLRPGKTLAMRVLLASPRSAGAVRRAKAPLRVLAMSAVACAIGGLVSTFGVAAAATGLRKLATLFVYPAWTWAIVRVAVAVVLMLPLAAGTAGVVLVTLLLRRRPTDDDCGRAVAEITAGLAAGLALAAGAWWLGANLLTVAFGCAAALIVAAMVSGTRGLAAAGNGPPPARPGLGRRRQRWLGGLLWAALAWGLTLQCRALRDALGTDWAWSWLWAAAAAAGIALTWIAQARTRARVSALAAAAAALAAGALAAMQTALLVVAAGRGADRWLWIALAAAGLGPTAVLAATVLARRRTLSVTSGCSRRLLLSDAAGACAVGMLGALWMLAWPTTGRTIAAAALAILAALALIGGFAGARRDPFAARPHLPWAAAAAALIVATALLALAAVRSARAALGPDVAVGASLTAVQTRAGSVEVLPLPRPRARRGAITALARRIVNARPGRWWIVPGRRADILDGLADGVRAEVYFPDPAMRRLPAYGGRGRPAGFQHYLNIQTRQLDGVYLAGPRADDPEAWCLHHRDVLQRCAGHLADGGVIMLHLHADHAGLGRLLAAARTFGDVDDEATAAVTVDGPAVEMLLVARPWLPPAAAPDELAATGDGVRVVPLAALLAALPTAAPRPISALAPRRRPVAAPTVAEFAALLESAATRPAEQ